MSSLSRFTMARPLIRQALNSVNNQKRFYYNRYSPFDEIQRTFDRTFRELERFPFSSFFRTPLTRTLPIETIENGNHVFKFEVDLPDFKPENIQITVKDGEVHIKAKHELNEENLKQHREFNYVYSLPKDVDIEKVRSLLRADGRLVIEAPMPEQIKLENKEIPIKRE